MDKKKVIFIMTDTQRTDMLGCYGYPDMKTPSLDRLAQDGIRFEKAYTTQPVCQPARSAIFTGSYPHSCAGWSNCMGLSDNVQNIGRRLTDQGIHSAYIGKWHLDGGDYFGLGRCADGWDPDYWYDMRCYLEELTEEERIRPARRKAWKSMILRKNSPMPTDAPSGPWIFWKKTGMIPSSSWYPTMSPTAPSSARRNSGPCMTAMNSPIKQTCWTPWRINPPTIKSGQRTPIWPQPGKISNCSPNITLAAIPLLTTK